MTPMENVSKRPGKRYKPGHFFDRNELFDRLKRGAGWLVFNDGEIADAVWSILSLSRCEEPPGTIHLSTFHKVLFDYSGFELGIGGPLNPRQWPIASSAVIAFYNSKGYDVLDDMSQDPVLWLAQPVTEAAS